MYAALVKLFPAFLFFGRLGRLLLETRGFLEAPVPEANRVLAPSRLGIFLLPGDWQPLSTDRYEITRLVVSIPVVKPTDSHDIFPLFHNPLALVSLGCGLDSCSAIVEISTGSPHSWGLFQGQETLLKGFIQVHINTHQPF